MTIASEITRLQGAKADIKTSIINKGVDVGDDLKLDDYSACIDAIEQGSGGDLFEVDYLLVGGGGGGGGNVGSTKGGGGGGGGGGVLEGHTILPEGKYSIRVGKGGSSLDSLACIATSIGGDTYFNGMIAKGGGAGMYSITSHRHGIPGGSGGGGGSCCFCACENSGGGSMLGQGSIGLNSSECYGGRGGGAGGFKNIADKGYYRTCLSCGYISNISGNDETYGSGGGGGTCTSQGDGPGGVGVGGGGNGACGCKVKGGTGTDGVVILRYPTALGYNISGGTKYVCGDYTIHRFTSDGSLSVGDANGCYISYMVVGGGGAGFGGSYGGGGGGGGDVRIGNLKVNNSLNIIVGCGGQTLRANGGDSSIEGVIIARGGLGATSTNGGDSGSGQKGGLSCCPTTLSCPKAGGGGAASNGYLGYGVWTNHANGWGGMGYFNMGGGGTGGNQNGTAASIDGGGYGAACSSSAGYADAKNYGGGGGGGGKSSNFGKGCQGVVDICYPTDGSFGFTSATGGDQCFEVGGICVHRFTSNGTFTIN